MQAATTSEQLPSFDEVNVFARQQSDLKSWSLPLVLAAAGAALAAFWAAVRRQPAAMDPLELTSIYTAGQPKMATMAVAAGPKVIKPKIRGFICTTNHPTGCEARVNEEIAYAKANKPTADGPKKVLVIGSSTGYGLSSRIAAAFGSGAATLGVFRAGAPAKGRPASAGWYNTAAFEKAAREEGLYAKSVGGDAFSEATKALTVETIKKDLGQVDLVVYSVATPRRTTPEGETYTSVLKPIGESFTNRTLLADKGKVTEVTLEPASQEEVDATVTVMGGADWELWIKALSEGGCLAPGAKTVAYSYIGPEMTWPVYWSGTIGAAKKDVEATAAAMKGKYDCEAYTAVAKALVTQASSAIPVVPLYICLLYKVMKEKGNHEGCIEQMVRMMNDRLYPDGGKVVTDNEGRIRMDDWEMQEDVQKEVFEGWGSVETETLAEMSDYEGYQKDFLRLFGFGIEGVDYDEPVDVNVPIPDLIK
jgi:enoyl-[acyl-carrier protein] reductase/trans-2-enoyl-CoA reductase (NAD+)